MISFKEFINEEKKIGKGTVDAHYVHKDYADKVFNNEELNKAKSFLPKDHEYTIVKRQKNSGEYSFIHSPDWDTSHEPIVGNSIKVKSDGSLSHTKMSKDPKIYHHKHEFVGDDYKGFNIEKSKQRSSLWKPVVDNIKEHDPKVKSRIGNKSYWDREVLSKINED